MMESQNIGDDNQAPDTSHPITDGATVVEGPVDVVAAVDGGVMGELGSGRGGKGGEVVKRKRGRPPKVQMKLPPAKKNKEEEEEEDVCFICFDGGSLVLCDRRGCPKAYHPACIKRDEAFFESAAKWDCGWHICSICQKSAHHMCYTCTYSLCRACIRKADYVCVRGDKGFCTICMKTIMLIENNGQGEDGKVQADFDDKLSWEYLFKVYWVYLKGKLSLTLDELTLAKNPWKEASTSSPLGVHNRADDLRSNVTASTSLGNLEANESKRRKIDDDEIKIPPNETVNMEKLGNEDNKTMVECKEWATKELLDFVAHMKDGNTSVLSRFDVQALVMEYINRNELSDPKRKNQIICDLRLKNLFGKPRIGRIQMLKLLEHHFNGKEDLRKRKVKSTEEQDDADWNPNNRLTVGKSRKSRNRSRGEERTPQNKLDEFAAVDVHNMSLIYLRRDLMEILLEDGANFHGKVVGSIVRIRISGSDQEHDMYRLVQVVGTSKVDEPYKIGSKLTDVMLEVLNLDKKETILIDAISEQEFSEEECRRLQQSIKCGLVKHFTVGEVQEKAVALQSVKLNDWIEKEILRLNHLRDVASEKGHKKGYRECMEKLQLLKTPDERDRRLQEIPEVHSDPKMNPDYESDDTEEYFNKEHGDHMESKFSGVSSKNPRSLKKRVGSSNDAGSRSRKNAQPKNTSTTTHQNVEEGSTKDTARKYFEKDASASTSGKSQNEVDCNASIITKLDHQPTLSSSVTNSAPEMIASSIPISTPDEMVWHYLDPNGKVQGPFSLALLQRWNTTGYFPADMKIWEKQEDQSLLLNDVLKKQFGNYDVRRSETMLADNKAGNQTEGTIVCSAIPSSTVAATPYAPNPINHEKPSNGHGSSGQSFGQNWSANNNLNSNPASVVSLTMSNESTGQLNTSNMPREMERNEADIRQLPTASKDATAALFDLPDPAPKMIQEDEKMQPVLDSKLLIQDSGNPPSWSSASSLVVGGAKLPVSADGWGGCSSTLVKREEWDSGIVSVSSFKPLEVAGDHVATPTSNIDQNIQPTCNDLPTWHGMSEMIEFSTLAEESVSDLLAEVDAMESHYGLPSPTSRRNSFVDDLFNDEFSPTPDQGTRSDGFSSSGDIHLPCHSTNTTTDEHINALDFMKTSNGLQQHSLISPEINAQIEPSYTVSIPQKENSEVVAFKWPDLEKAPQGMIDINSLARAEGDDGEMETKANDDVQVKVKVEYGNYAEPVAPLDTSHGKAGGVVQSTGELKSGVALSGERPMLTLKTACAKLVTKVAQGTGLDVTTNHRKAGGVFTKEEDGEFIQPPEAPQPPKPPLPPPPLTLGLDPYEPHGLGLETMQGKPNHSGRAGQGTNTHSTPSGNSGWDPDPDPEPSPNQRRYGVERERHNTRSHHHQVEDSGRSRSSRSSWNNKQSSPVAVGGSSRPPSKGQRICRFNESGRCRKGASCKYLHQ